MFGDIVYQGCHSIISATPTLIGELHGIQFLLNMWREVGQDSPLQGFHGKGSESNRPVVVEYLRGGDFRHMNDGAGFPEVGSDASVYRLL